MKKFIGVMLVSAIVMSLGGYNKHRGWEIPADEDPEREGYMVNRDDGTQAWINKELFEKTNLPLADPEGNSVRQEDVDNFILSGHDFKIGNRTTAMHYNLKNGFEIVESSSCVDPANYNADIGMEICNQKVKDKVWNYLGFLLQCARGGMK